jgi:hypothetical protein
MDEYFLSAVIGGKGDLLQVRTTEATSENLDALLQEDPTAITLAPAGELATEQLLRAFRTRDSLISSRSGVRSSQVARWRYYARRASENLPHLVRSIGSADLRTQIHEIEARKQHQLLAFVREDISSQDRSGSDIDLVVQEVMRRRRRVRIAVSAPKHLESANREALRKVREQMLKMVPTYTSADLAAACDSSSINPSQFAADMRKANRIFAVRLGRDWRYPRFQFNHADKPIEPFPEMKEVLASLAPDKRGWDRLQWFLDPNSKLGERTPLEVWEKNRPKVIEAARGEQWNARD